MNPNAEVVCDVDANGNLTGTKIVNESESVRRRNVHSGDGQWETGCRPIQSRDRFQYGDQSRRTSVWITPETARRIRARCFNFATTLRARTRVSRNLALCTSMAGISRPLSPRKSCALYTVSVASLRTHMALPRTFIPVTESFFASGHRSLESDTQKGSFRERMWTSQRPAVGSSDWLGP
jgi:hypothetical protein